MHIEQHFANKWLVVCHSSQLKDQPKGFQINGKKIVIFRSGNHIRALEDRCPHRNTPLSCGKLRNGNIQCPYHGWEFSEFGECVNIPGFHTWKANPGVTIPSFVATEKDNLIWINLSPIAVMSHIPTVLLSSRGISADVFFIKSDIQSNLVNALENLLDGFHTPFVHNGLVRTPNKRQDVKARIFASSDRVEVEYSGETKQSGLLSRLFEYNRTLSYGRFILPSIAQLEYCDNRGTALLISVFFTPIRDDQLQIHAVIETPKRKAPAFIKKFILKTYFLYILKQDKNILKIQKGNIDSFKGEKFTSTRLDFFRPYITQLLQPDNSPTILKNEQVEIFHL